MSQRSSFCATGIKLTNQSFVTVIHRECFETPIFVLCLTDITK